MSTPNLISAVRSSLVASPDDAPAVAIAGAVREAMPWQSEDAVRAAHELATSELVGAGPLAAILAATPVTAVLAPGARSVSVERGAKGRTNNSHPGNGRFFKRPRIGAIALGINKNPARVAK